MKKQCMICNIKFRKKERIKKNKTRLEMKIDRK